MRFGKPTQHTPGFPCSISLNQSSHKKKRAPKGIDLIGVPMDLIIQEVEAMNEVSFAKTASRSILGSMADFAYLAEHSLASGHSHGDLTGLSVFLADTPCSPLRPGDGFPDKAALAMVEEGWPAAGKA